MKRINGILLLIFMLVLSGCGNNIETQGSTSGSNANGLKKVKVLLPAKGTAVYGAYVAEKAGFFKEEGLEVELIAGGHGSTYVVQQVGAGTEKFGFSVASAVMPALEKGIDLKYVYSVNVRNLFDFITPAQSGIDKIEKLKGKVVGISDLGGGEVPMVRAILEGAGLKVDEDVKLRAIGTEPAMVLSAFEKGEIDAYSSGANDLVYLYASGFDAISLVPEEYNSLPTTGLVITDETLAKEKDLVIKMGRAMAKATLFSITNPEAAFKIMKEAVPEQYEDEKVGRIYLDTYIKLTTPLDSGQKFGYIDKESWKVTLDLFLKGENPVLSAPVDLNKLLDDSLLSEMNNFDKDKVKEKAKNWNN